MTGQKLLRFVSIWLIHLKDQALLLDEVHGIRLFVVKYSLRLFVS